MTRQKRIIAGYAAAAASLTVGAAIWALPAASQAGTDAVAGPAHQAAAAQPAGMRMAAASGTLTSDIAAARVATAKYATNLAGPRPPATRSSRR